MSPTKSLIILEDDFHCFNIKKDLETYPPDMLDRIKDKIIEIVEDEPFKFKTVILKFILAHEYAFANKYKEALEILDELECDMKLLEEIGCDNYLFEKVSKAFLNMLRTCKTYVFISKNDDKKARELVSSIVPLTDLDSANQAGVFGIRSMAFMEYGLYGHKMALELAEKANKMDPENPYWHFLIGKSLGRIRRVEKPYDIPSDEERNALKAAIRMQENYLFMLFTAESYVETSSRTYRFHVRNRSLYPSLKVAIDAMNEEASTLYSKCIEMQPNCSHVLFRAARGFLNLPHPQRDPERAKELLVKGLELNPRNPFANHLLARYYERYGSNIPEAIKRLQLCREQRVFGAEMDLLRLEYAKDGKSANIVDKLTKLLDVYQEVPRKLQLLTQIASYYIFIESNLPKACELIKKAITLNCDDNILNHRSIFLRVRHPFSLLDVLVDELKIEMDKKCDNEKKKLYESFIFDMNDSNIAIPRGRGKNLKAEILKEDEDIRSGNYVKRSRNMNGPSQMRRRSFAKPIPKDREEVIEKSQSVQKVDDFFDSWINEAKNDDNKRYNGAANRNTSCRSSLSESISDLSPASDSRFASTRGRYNKNRYSKRDNDADDTQFDRLSSTSRSSRDRPSYSRPKKYENGDYKQSTNNLEDDFDRLSISSRNSEGRSGFSKGARGRGKSSYSGSRPYQLQDRGDFDRGSLARGRGRRTNFNDNRNYNDSSASTFSRGRGLSNPSRRSPEKFDYNNANGSRNSPNKSSFDRTRSRHNSESSSPHKSGRNEVTSNDSRAKTTDQDRPKYQNKETNRTDDYDDSNISKKSSNSRNERKFESSPSSKSWRSQIPSSRSPAKTTNQDGSKNKEAKPSFPAVQNDSDSDEDLMSYFKKK